MHGSLALCSYTLSLTSCRRCDAPSSYCCTILHFSLYKRLFHLQALLWESIILLLPPPTCNAFPIIILSHDHRAMYALPPSLPLYAIYHTILVMAISCKGQNYIGLLHAVGLASCSPLIPFPSPASGWDATASCMVYIAPGSNGPWLAQAAADIYIYTPTHTHTHTHTHTYTHTHTHYIYSSKLTCMIFLCRRVSVGDKA